MIPDGTRILIACVTIHYTFVLFGIADDSNAMVGVGNGVGEPCFLVIRQMLTVSIMFHHLIESYNSIYRQDSPRLLSLSKVETPGIG